MASLKMEELELMNNPKYRQYASAVEKALKAFEFTTEWADLIAALGKLGKVLQANSKFGSIPKPVTVAKRLSQCLHPALPPGVHLRALETYRQIFSVMGTEGLSKVVHLYSIGIFPLLTNAGIRVRTELILILETYFLPLGSALTPALVGLLNGLLPGLEDGSEFYDRTNSLLERVVEAVGSNHFYSALWHCVFSSPQIRLPALLFVVAHLDRKKPMDDQLFIVGSSVDLMVMGQLCTSVPLFPLEKCVLQVMGLCATAEDENVLAQRHMLDFLTVFFPLHSQHLVAADFVRLVQTSLFLILKRDMSLNRRLYNWFLGVSQNSPTRLASESVEKVDLSYFEEHSLPLIVSAARNILNLENLASPDQAIRYSKALLHLMDRPEIGDAVLDRTLTLLLRYFMIYTDKYCEKPLTKYQRRRCVSSSQFDKNSEIGKAINALVNSLDPGYVWNNLANSLTSGEKSIATRIVCDLVVFCLSAVQLDSHSDIRCIHIPNILLRFLQAIPTHMQTTDVEFLLATSLSLLQEIQQSCGTVLLDRQGTEQAKQAEAMAGSDCDRGRQPSLVSEVSTEPPTGMPIPRDELIGAEGQVMVEKCLDQFLSCLSTIWRACVSHTQRANSPLTLNACRLLREFADFPLYCLPAEENKKEADDCGEWVKGLSHLCLSRWKNHGDRPPVSEDSEPLETLLYVVVLSKSMEEQRAALLRNRESMDGDGDERTTHVFLKPLLRQHHLAALQQSPFYREMAETLWRYLAARHGYVQQEAARLFCILHSSECSELSSVCESVCVRDLTSSDSELRADGTQKFRDMWVLARSANLDEVCPGIPLKPFHRALLVMLTSAVSETVDATREISRSWLLDCLQHGDLPKLIQLNILLLLLPLTARVSIQYLTANTDNLPSDQLLHLRMPNGGSLYHLQKQSSCLADTPMALAELKREVLSGQPGKERHLQSATVATKRFSFDEDVECGGEESVEDAVAVTLRWVVNKVVEEVDAGRVALPVDVEIGSEAILDMSEHFGHGRPESGSTAPEEIFHPLHAHFLVYTEGSAAELERPEHVFRSLTGLLRLPSVGSVLVSCLSSTKSGTLRNAYSARLGEWTMRHMKSIVGKDFLEYKEGEEEKDTPVHKQYMYMELLINLCLYYIRSYHLNSPISPVSQADLAQNWDCKVACLEFLRELLDRLGSQIEERGRSFATYIADVLVKAKFQKCLLHSLMVSAQDNTTTGGHLSEDILEFNTGAFLPVAYQSSLLSVVASLVRLEFQLKTAKANVNSSGIVVEKLSVTSQISPIHTSLSTVAPLVELRLFLLTLLNALKGRFHLHHLWLRFLIQCLPYLGRSLPSVTLHLSEQLGKNIEHAVQSCYLGPESQGMDIELPINYVCFTLESLALIWHRCLLGSSAPLSISPSSDVNQNWKAGEIFTNLIKAFTFVETASTNDSPLRSQNAANCLASAKAELLGALPHVLSTLCHLWTAVKDNRVPLIPVGSPQNVRRLILDLLNPIALNHSTNLLSSLALVWLTRRPHNIPEKLLCYSDEQLDVADLLLSIKVLPLESFLSAMAQTLKEPVKVKDISDKDAFPIEISLLQILHCSLHKIPAALLRTCWGSMHKILSDLVTFSSFPSVFLAYSVFVDYVRIFCTTETEEKKVLKEMQDLFQKLVELMNGIVALQLEQTTWLKRTLVVKTVENGLVNGGDSGGSSDSSVDKSNPGDRLSTEKMKKQSIAKDELDKKNIRYSTQALSLLADTFAGTLDAICKSEDRDRLVPSLNTVWANALPYLRTRSENNAVKFLIASKMLASLSHYSYTRNVWKKATMEIFLDSIFFRMDRDSLTQWLLIVDNLMTQDKTSFKDFLARLGVVQGPSLFVTKEQEYDMRATSLRRLAFVILSSQLDQYQTNLPDIQERLTENLRLEQVPHVQAQVFLCFRVLLIRLSPYHLTPFWPVFITETVQVLLLIEQELTTVTTSTNDYKPTKYNEQWLQLYLAVCKFLSALVSLPPSHLAQFQMYQWAFSGPNLSDSFIPHTNRIYKLLTSKYGVYAKQEGCVENLKSVSTLRELIPLLKALSQSHHLTSTSAESSLQERQTHLEQILHIDFMD